MNKIELKIVGLTQSNMQTSSYAVILGEVDANRRLPIIIGIHEAQAIAVALEEVESTRPLTHDLLKNVCDQFEIEVTEVIISDLRDGIFYGKLICLKNGQVHEVDSRSSDALALALRFACPIYTYENIMDTAGISLEGTSSGEPASADSDRPGSSRRSNYSKYSVEELNKLLEKAISDEDYEKAAKIRDEMNNKS